MVLILFSKTYSEVLLQRSPTEMFAQCKEHKDFCMAVPVISCLPLIMHVCALWWARVSWKDMSGSRAQHTGSGEYAGRRVLPAQQTTGGC